MRIACCLPSQSRPFFTSTAKIGFSVFLACAWSAPLLTRAQTNDVDEKGFASNGVYQKGGVDSVNIQNGDLHISIPIVSLPQRGGSKFTASLEYDSPSWLKQWETNDCGLRFCNPTGYWVVEPNPNVASGWRFSTSLDWDWDYDTVTATCPSTSVSYSYTTNYRIYDPLGGTHPLALRTESSTCQGQTLSGPTLDGSGMTLDSTTGIVRGKDGSILFPTHSDPNGNLSSLSSDTLGRVPYTTVYGPTTTYTAPSGLTASGPSYINVNVIDSNGHTETYQINYVAIDVTTDICSHTSGPYPCTDSSMVWLTYKSLTLPTGRVYSFNYANGTPADLSELDLPNGGSVKYSYSDYYQPVYDGHGTTASWSGGRTISTRQEVVGGVSNPPWQYTISGPTSTVTDPVGNVQVHSFATVSSGPSGSYRYTPNTYETQVIYKDSTGAVLRTENTDWAGDVDYNANITINPRPIRKTLTLDTGQQSKIEKDYETFTYTCPTCNTSAGTAGIATRMNVTEERVYDYGSSAPGSLIKTVDYGYLHTGSATYQNLNIVDRATSVTIYDGSGTMASQSINEYDNYSRSTQPMTASGATRHDPGFGTSFTTRGNLTGIFHWRSTDGAYPATTYQYDDAGNKLSSIDPKGQKTTFGYADAFANTACAPGGGGGVAFLTSVSNAKGQLSSSTYNSCTGTLASTTDLNSQSTSYTYTVMDRALQVLPPTDAGKTTYCYTDDPSGTCYSTTGMSISTTDAVSSSINTVRTTVLDGMGRVSQTQLNSDPDGVSYVDTKYDVLGRVSQVSSPYRSGDTEYWTTTQYDGLGRVHIVGQADGSSESTTYSGNTSLKKDEAFNQRESVTDALGRLTTVYEDPSGLNYETDYQYDVLGNLHQVTQKGGDPSSSNWRVRTFTYDSLGELLCSANPEIGSPSASTATCPYTDTGAYITGTIRYQYDDDGNLTSKISPLPNQTASATLTSTYTYDVLNRTTSISYSDGTTPASYYTYDTDAPAGCTPPSFTSLNPMGHLRVMCDGSGATVWSFDTVGRTKTEKRAIGSAIDQIDYTYYLNGEVNTITYPLAGQTSRFVVTYSQNAAGRVYQAAGSDGVTYAHVSDTWATGASHDWQLGSNISVTESYNARLQPQQITATQISTTNTLFSRTYDFHAGSTDNGNLYGVLDGLDGLGLSRPNGSVTYTYDTLNRIATAATAGSDCTIMPGGTKDWAASYTVDAWGNLTAKSSTVCTSETLSSSANARNRLAAASYDSAGNVLTENSLGYTYDAESRIINGAGSAYVYDGSGERVHKTGKLYWKGVGSTSLAETDESDANPTQYVFFGGARIARKDPGASTPILYIADNLGSTALTTDSLGNVLNESLFFPYGVERQISTGDSANNYKFTGKERDPETGLDDFGARYYNSALGRFMTPDWAAKPAAVPYAVFGDPQTLNLYAYVQNGPLNRVDADGHASNTALPNPALYGFDADQVDACVFSSGHACTGEDVETMLSNNNGYESDATRETNAATAEEADTVAEQQAGRQAQNQGQPTAQPAAQQQPALPPTCPVTMPTGDSLTMVQTLMGEQTPQGASGTNQYGDNQAGRHAGAPNGSTITNATLDNEATQMVTAMQNLGNLGNPRTYDGYINGVAQAAAAQRSAPGSPTCIQLQRDVSAVNNRSSQPNPSGPHQWRAVRQGGHGHTFVRQRQNATRIAGTDFF